MCPESGYSGGDDPGEEEAHPMRAPAGAAPAARLAREDWIRAALETLVEGGVGAVKVLALARRLGTSRSGFYWFFRSRADLLDRLLEHWQQTNTRAIVERAALPAASIGAGVLNIFACWIDESLFQPRLDFAVREWARRAPAVRRAVDDADRARVAAIAGLFARHGYGEREAFIRARVLYFMQIGYYSLELAEPLATRLAYTPDYLAAFTGRVPDPREIDAFVAAVRARPQRRRATSGR
jgi:AcrR family transcriptional regulator